jgi:effector-binding domain-containing protein
MSYEVDLVDLQEQRAAVVRGVVPHHEIGSFLGRAFGEVMAAVDHQDLHVSGAPIARYRSAGTEAWDVEAGFPVHGVPVAEGRVEAAKLPGGRMAKTLHVGAYADVGQAYAAVQDWLVGHGYAAEGDPWECYLDGPEVPRPRTEIFFPCHQVKPVRA